MRAPHGLDGLPPGIAFKRALARQFGRDDSQARNADVTRRTNHLCGAVAFLPHPVLRRPTPFFLSIEAPNKHAPEIVSASSEIRREGRHDSIANLANKFCGLPPAPIRRTTLTANASSTSSKCCRRPALRFFFKTIHQAVNS